MDSNQDIVMNDGTLVVMGPTGGGDGALDYDGSFTMNGGTLLAAGSSDMAMAPSSSSKQVSLMINADTVQSANTILYIQDTDGNLILGVSPAKSWQNVVLSSSALSKGSTYEVYVGGTPAKVQNGVVTKADGGTKLTSLTVNDTITLYGSGGMRGGGQGGGMHP